MRKDEFPIVDRHVKKEINAILDEIKAEIDLLIDYHDCHFEIDGGKDFYYCVGCNHAIDIINKYRYKESED